MKNDSNHDISIGFVIQPVHDKNEREQANEKIQRINDACFEQIAVIIILDERQWEVPNAPVQRKHT